MKRRLLLAALLVFATLLLCGAAQAATDPIVCSMEVSPDTLSAPGDVTVTITISNSGDTDMQEALTLYSPTSEVVTDFGDGGSVTLKAGEVKTWTGTWAVNQHTLDNGQIVYFIKYALYDENGEREVKSQPIRGKLTATTATTDIEVKRTITPGTAREGQTVTVQYDIVNTGTLALKNITLEENKDINAKKVTVADELKAGATAKVKFTVTMGKKDLTSNAVITYTSEESKDKLTEKVDEQVIHFGEVSMTAKLTASAKGVAINGTVTLSLELKNGGTVDYTDIRVTDKTLGDVFTNQVLAAGGTLSLDKEITLTETTEYQFTISAIDNTGTEVSLDTDPVTVTAVDPNNIVHLNLIAAADRTEVYTQPGIVRFSLTVENDSEVDATDVMIYEADTKLYTFASIPAGESRKLTRDAELSMAGKYQFTAETVDALGTTNTFESNEIQIAFSVPTAAPATPTPAAEPTPEPTYAAVTYVPISDPSVGTTPKLVRAFFYPLLWVSGILLACAAVLLIFATRKRVRDKKASDAALDHLDRAKRRDYVAPNEEGEEAEAEPAPEPETTYVAEEEILPEAKPEPEKAADKTSEEELPHMKYVRDAYRRSEADRDAAEKKQSLYDEEPLQPVAAETPAAEAPAPEAPPARKAAGSRKRKAAAPATEAEKPVEPAAAVAQPEAEEPAQAGEGEADKPRRADARRHRRTDGER